MSIVPEGAQAGTLSQPMYNVSPSVSAMESPSHRELSASTFIASRKRNLFDYCVGTAEQRPQ